MKNKFFSIIIPAYNVEKYLYDCVSSLQHQTYPDFEIIVVDDGSIDSTPEICDNLSNQFPLLTIKILHQTNQRQVAARMNGIDIASGDYCLFIDADDKLVESALEQIKNAIEKYCADIIIYNGIRFWNGGSVPFWSHYRDKESFFEDNDFLELKRDILKSNRFNNVWNKAFRRDVIVNAHRFTDVSFISTEEDYMMQLPWFDLAKNAVYLPINLYLYRLNIESITFQKFDKDKFKTALYLYDVEKLYSQKWNLPNAECVVVQNFLNRVASSVKQFYNKHSGLNFKQKRDYLIEISDNQIFRLAFKKSKRSISSKVGQIILLFLYYKLWWAALFLAEHDPKVHGNVENITCIKY